MPKEILREITPLMPGDCFTIFYREKKEFDFPLHYHDEYELNFILNAPDAQRIIGDHIDLIGEMELALVGPNLPHGWFTHNCKSEKIFETTIQFHRDMLEDKFLKRDQLSLIRQLLHQSNKGILFSKECMQQIGPKINDLTRRTGFDSVLGLLSILHDLSIARNSKTLSDSYTHLPPYSYNSRRIEKVTEYIYNNYQKEITLGDVAHIANMPETSFSRFIKKHTGRTFIDTLNELRLGHASRLLIETTNSVAEIAYDCGFNNISYFNRVFKKLKNCTPKEYRDHFSEIRVFI